ncbi:hypothetical protein [Thiocapsa rosea]|uniref:hypothetical protein n=1 Tax=Thiocapsa rosea TaxID=69360 RepID=UPI000EB4E912|nr:hypothetical protein [Thiocapsa rosea]
MFADIARGADPAALKSEDLIRDGLTARQYNTIAMNLKGKIDAIKARCVGLISEARARIKKAKQVITKLDLAITRADHDAERRRLRAKRHRKCRRLARQSARLARMQSDQDTDTVRLCFGGRKGFRAQFDPDRLLHDTACDLRAGSRSGRGAHRHRCAALSRVRGPQPATRRGSRPCRQRAAVLDRHQPD